MTAEQRRAAVEEIVAWQRDSNYEWLRSWVPKFGGTVERGERSPEAVSAIEAILARHDQPAVTDHARKAAEDAAGLVLDTIEQCFGLKAPNGRADSQKAVTDTILYYTSRAIADSERELVEGLEPFARWITEQDDVRAMTHPIFYANDFPALEHAEHGETDVTFGQLRHIADLLANRGRK